MKRLFALSFVALVAFAPAAFANTQSPSYRTAADNSINQTGCHHGASDQPCKPDPQPDHGNDCSNPSGGNQDHCLDTTTSTTSQPSTTTTSAPTTTTTASAGSVSSTTSTTDPLSATTTTTAAPSVPDTPTTSVSGAPAVSAPTTPPAALPMTGSNHVAPLLWVALVCLFFGGWFLWMGRESA